MFIDSTREELEYTYDSIEVSGWLLNSRSYNDPIIEGTIWHELLDTEYIGTHYTYATYEIKLFDANSIMAKVTEGTSEDALKAAFDILAEEHAKDKTKQYLKRNAGRPNETYTEVDGTSFIGAISGTKTGTVSLSCGSGQHTIQLKYYKDGSQSSGRDNVIVTLGVNQEYTNTTKYQKEIEQKICGGEVIGTTGNERWVEYEKNSYDCGFIGDRWVEVDEDGDGERDKMCCGDNGEYFEITRIEGTLVLE